MENKIPKLCLCGCSGETKYSKQKKCYNDYLLGHNKPRLGSHITEDNKRKLISANKNRHPSDKTKQKMRNGNAGKHAYLKEYCGWNKGQSWSEEIKSKMSLSRMGHVGNNGSFKKGQIPWSKGKPAPHGAGRGRGSYCDMGYWVRSSYERSFSDGMYTRNIEHIYESELFHLKGGISYRPDYLILKLNLYIELKGWITTRNKIQHELFRRQGHKLLVLDGKFFQRDRLFEQVLCRLEEVLNGK